jgi:membrane-associated phospholipid phosphatase
LSDGTTTLDTAPTASADARPVRPVVRRIGWVAIANWLVALAAQTLLAGVPFDREGVLAWIAAGLLAASIGRRPLWTVIVDWLPFAAVLIAYDYARGISDTLGMPVLWHQPVDADRALSGGVVPTVWLQEHLKLGHSPWWEAGVSLTYVAFFLMPYVVAGVHWLRARAEFRRWAYRFVAMSFLGVACFILIPAAPPWAAAACRPVDVANHPSNPGCMYFPARYAGANGLLGSLQPVHAGAHPYVERLSGRGWEAVHIPVARELLDKGQRTVDLVAAVPSLHAGCTLLLSIFAWTRVRKRWRPLLVAYPAVMAFSLVYSAEHYVVDVLAGWLLAVLVSLAFGRWELRRNKAAALDTLMVQSPTVREHPCPPIATTQWSTSPNGAVSSTRPARSTAELDRRGTTGPSASS